MATGAAPLNDRYLLESRAVRELRRSALDNHVDSLKLGDNSFNRVNMKYAYIIPLWMACSLADYGCHSCYNAGNCGGRGCRCRRGSIGPVDALASSLSDGRVVGVDRLAVGYGIHELVMHHFTARVGWQVDGKETCGAFNLCQF